MLVVSGHLHFDKTLAIGKHTITLMQTDAAGFTSEVSLRLMCRPKAASLSELAVDTVHTETVSVADSVGLNTLKVSKAQQMKRIASSRNLCH